jgi:fumarate reductase subunit C
MAVSVIHFVFGLLVFRHQLAQIAQMGWLGGVARDPTLAAVTWFMLFSAPLVAAGITTNALERQGAALPRALAWWLLGTAALGVALMPASGFYLVLPPALAILIRARRLNANPIQSRAST